MELAEHYYYVGIDLETTANGYNGSPNAAYRNNKILTFGSTVSSNIPWLTQWLTKKISKPKLIIGHHLQFDLAYLIRDYPNEPWHTYNYWCTAVAEYILSGHTDTFPSLVDTAAKYSIIYKKKIDIESWLASGKRMEDLDLLLLQQYANEDAGVAKEIAMKQFKLAYDVGGEKLIQLILDQSANIPALCSIELNGMSFDTNKAGTILVMNDHKLHDIEVKIKDNLEIVYGWPRVDIEKLNVTANRTASAILYGYPAEIEVGKRKKDKRGLKFNKPLYSPPLEEPNPTLGYSVSEEKLEGLKDWYSTEVLEYRKLVKESNTYLSPLIDRANKHDKKVYTNINTTSTNTGRTSSSSPNFQNLPDSIRELFYSESNNLWEIDFKQLELCGIAELSGDEQLIQDIKDGVDIHYETGKPIYGWTKPSDADPKDRRDIKSIIFGLCYGGGATTLSVQSGVPVVTVRAIISHFYDRYKGVHKWHEATLEDAKSVAWQTTEAHSDGQLKKQTRLTIEQTGRYFIFNEQQSPEWMRRQGKNWSFPPTKLKNYRAQGFAGGDIVLNFLKVLYHFLGGETSPIRLVNMIHDSIVADVPKEHEELFKDSVVKARMYIEQYLKLKVPLTIETKASGKYWK